MISALYPEEIPIGISVNTAYQAIKTISPILKKLSSGLKQDSIYINDNDNNLHTSSYYISPNRQLLFISMIKQLLVFTHIFNQAVVLETLSLQFNIGSRRKQKSRQQIPYNPSL